MIGILYTLLACNGDTEPEKPVNTPPRVELTAPLSTEHYYSDQLIQFAAVVSDAEDAPADLSIAWSSNVDGELSLDTSVNSAGELSDYGYLSSGSHAIELRVEDSSGDFSTAEVVLDVAGPNTIPTCTIDEPLDGASAAAGSTITFRGTADDPDIPNNLLTTEWTSDKDGSLNTSTPTSSGAITFAYDELSVDTHTISLIVTDEVGASCTEQILLSVGNPPTASIEEPADGSVFALGEAIVFNAVVSDSEDQNSQIAVRWSSDIDGELQSESANSQGVSQFSSDTLSAGTHTIELSATDSSGLVTDDLISIRVNSLPVVDSISLSPSSPEAADSLLCEATASDSEGSVTLSFSFDNATANIAYAATVTTATTASLDLSTVSANVGDEITCQVVATDDDGGTISSSASVLLANTAPTLDSILISPTAVSAGTTVNCTATASDANDGDLTSSIQYEWSVNGTVLSTGSTHLVSATDTNVGDSLMCTATATDSAGTSISDTASVTVANSSPVLSNLQVTSSSSGYYNDDTLTCSIVATDAEDTPSVSFDWSSQGVVLLSTSGSVQTSDFDLSSAAILPGDSVTCTVEASDSNGASTSDFTTLSIDNRAPDTPAVVISWTAAGSTPVDTDDLTCTASATDPDGESPSYSYTWLSSAGVSVSGDTVTASQTTAGETWTCTATASDGALTSAPTSTDATIGGACGTSGCDYSIDLGNGIVIDWVFIAGGLEPLGRYTLSNDFYMGTTEVTQEMFSTLMPYDPMTYSTFYAGYGSDYPVYYASWNMIADFANTLTQLHNAQEGTSLQECYTCSNSGATTVTCTEAMNPYQCDGYSIPTEAEFEYATRAGSATEFWTPDGGGSSSASDCGNLIDDTTVTILDGVTNPPISDYAWWCGNQYDPVHANCGANSCVSGSAKPVGLKLPNGYGLYDMHGNMREFTTDWYGCTFPNSTVDPYCSTIGGAWPSANHRIVKSGCWACGGGELHASSRFYETVSYRSSGISFRLVRHD